MSQDKEEGFDYYIGAIICGFLGFAATWVYAMSEWGLLMGLMFGWFPALIAGVIVGVLWPLFLIGFIWVLIQIL